MDVLTSLKLLCPGFFRLPERQALTLTPQDASYDKALEKYEAAPQSKMRS
jgi:hypothetical protein